MVRVREAVRPEEDPMYRTMMFTRTRQLVIPALAAVAVVGLAGAALAANVDLVGSNAGQGVAEVEGFEVSDIEYRTDATAGSTTTALVDGVEFTIERSDDIDGANQSGSVSDADAEVWLQLRSTIDGSAAASAWVLCDTSTEDRASCDTTALAVSMSAIDEISIVAFDSLENPNIAG